MERKYRLLMAAIALFVALDVAAIVGWSAEVRYGGSHTTSFGTVTFINDSRMYHLCGPDAGACIYVDAGLTMLPEEEPPLKQYLKCGHEKQHYLHPESDHGETMLENYVYFENTFGWHPECAAIALNYH